MLSTAAMAAIIRTVRATTSIDNLLVPLTADPATTAVLLDVDGTLAPIVRQADNAHVPETTRAPLTKVARDYGVTACVSGRRAAVARRIVSLGTMSYIGNHGVELLRAGGTQPEIAPEVAAYRDQIQRFAKTVLDGESVPRVRLRGEDKSVIYAFHWRGAPDAAAAERLAQTIAERAEAEGLWVHWGRMVLEVRPPVALTKGSGVTSLLAEHPELRSALYIGDDRTDIDAFDALRAMHNAGVLQHVLCVGVRSTETPQELIDKADALVDGPEGVRAVLERLAAAL